MTIYLCQKCRTVMDTECKELERWHHVSDAWKCTGCGQHIDCHNEIHLHHLQEAFDAVKIVREQTKDEPAGAVQMAAEEVRERWGKPIQKAQNDGIEAYLRLYLEMTGKSINELELCTQTKYEDMNVTVTHWLQEKKS